MHLANELDEKADKFDEQDNKKENTKRLKEEKREQRLRLERERLARLSEYENKYAHLSYIAGVDEAGRGPLAGPVVAASVILAKDEEILYLNDSKKLSEKKREALYDEIVKKALAYAVAVVDVARIEEINILQASLEAMRQAVNSMSIRPDILLSDALLIPDLDIEQLPIVKGDAKSKSIAAASILAKVSRDRLMLEYDRLYPLYGFARHKGYGTPEHREKLRLYGPCEIHRLSFLGKLLKK